MAEVTYHSTVQSVRKSHRNAIVGLLLNIVQMGLMVGIFYVMISVLGLRSSAVRGDFILYLFTGIFMYMTHVKTVGAVSGAASSSSSMLQHAPLNTVVSIMAAALGALYNQLLAMMVILFVVHVAWRPIEVDQPVGIVAMLFLSWFFGVAVGLVFYALKPWFPLAVGMLTMTYRRVNMFASGKMVLANTLPASILVFFDWNPLFHTIDQARGFAFINYNPHFSSIIYPVKISIILLVIGMMGEFYTRRHNSASWSAGH